MLPLTQDHQAFAAELFNEVSHGRIAAAIIHQGETKMVLRADRTRATISWGRLGQDPTRKTMQRPTSRTLAEWADEVSDWWYAMVVQCELTSAFPPEVQEDPYTGVFTEEDKGLMLSMGILV